MGTEKTGGAVKSINRSKPPPVPPRPQHLIPAKALSKYSSMPDILNGWKKDPNPDLLRLPGAVVCQKGSTLDMVRRGGNPVEYSLAIANGVEKSKKSNLKHPFESSATARCEKSASGKALKKFSCIPSRSNSKKKKNSDSAGWLGKSNSRAEISQTSWYVEDVDNAAMHLSKCEISVNSDRNYRYVPEKPPAVVVGSGSSSNKFSPHRPSKQLQQPPTMSSSLSGLPPLPKSFSDASLLWDSTTKKLSSGPVSLSPSSSSASSSSRTSSCIHPKVPPPAVPRSNSVSASLSSDEQTLPAYQSRGSLPREERPPPPPPPRKPTSLDMKLSLLRKEMHVLRQMDLSLLSQLWSLNEAIHEFRQMQDSLSPNSPSLHSSDEEDSGCYHSNISSQGGVTSNPLNTLGSNSSRSSVGTCRSALRDNVKP